MLQCHLGYNTHLTAALHTICGEATCTVAWGSVTSQSLRPSSATVCLYTNDPRLLKDVGKIKTSSEILHPMRAECETYEREEKKKKKIEEGFLCQVSSIQLPEELWYYAPHVAPLMSHLSCTITTLTLLHHNPSDTWWTCYEPDQGWFRGQSSSTNVNYSCLSLCGTLWTVDKTNNLNNIKIEAKIWKN